MASTKHIVKRKMLHLAPYPLWITIEFTNDVGKSSCKSGWKGDIGDAYFATYADGTAGIVLHHKASVPLIVHEVTHCVLTLFRSIQHDVRSEDEEPVAYMMQHIVAEILKFQKEVKGKFRGR